MCDVNGLIIRSVGKCKTPAHAAACYLLSIALGWGATYYVDFDSGSDANDGTSRSTPFKTLPGTRNAADNDYLNAAWGSFTTSAKVPNGTIFKLKSGQRCTAISRITREYYTEAAATNGAYQFVRDTTWGTGPVVFDWTGTSCGIAGILVQVHGVTWDGITTNGIVVSSNVLSGMQFKEIQGSGDQVQNVIVRNLKFLANGTSLANDTAGAGIGQLSLRHVTNALVENVSFDGGSNYISGIICGNGHMRVVGGLIRNCSASNHRGSNDNGIGFLALNSDLIISNVVAFNNYKGADLGEDHGDNVNISYTVINSSFYSNKNGINANGPGSTSYSGTSKFNFINLLVHDNPECGSQIYSGPFEANVVHCVYDRNGTESPGYYSHIASWMERFGDTNHTVLRVYNCIFTNGGTYVFNADTAPATGADLTWDMDYNWYGTTVRNAFVNWGWQKTYSFGRDGPGHASGQYYTEYRTSATPPQSGTGHYHCDAHSKGARADDATVPPLTSGYMLTAHYPGADLSTYPWYIPEIGRDRTGAMRSSWDIGAYEAGVRPSPPQDLRETTGTRP